MGDESDIGTHKVVQMGADNSPSATSRLVTLQTRKQQLEERISAKNKELRRLCIQEAELTGVMPPEIPLEPGETLPTFRKRVGTAFEYPQNIINSLCYEDESVPNLETKIEVQKKIAEAALQLANNATMSKAIRRDNMSLYRKTKQELDFMEERLKVVKNPGKGVVLQNQLKQKKKPRPFLDADSISTKSSNPSQGEETINRNYVHQRSQSRYMLNKYHGNSYLSEGDLHQSDNQSYHVSDDNLIPPLSKLALSNYDRNSNDDSHIQTAFSHSSPNIYHQQHHHHQQYLINSQTLPHMSPTMQYQREREKAAAVCNYPTYSHSLVYPNNRRYHLDERKYNYHPDTYTYPYYNNSNSHPMLMHLSQNYKHMSYMEANQHPHLQSQTQSQPQYEPEVSSAGLGGHWFKTETGEMIWCTTHDDVSTWHTDKRFGSLDRRKAKHIRNKRNSPNLDIASKQTPIPVTVPVPVPASIPAVPVPVRAVFSSQDIPRPMTLQSMAMQTSTRPERHDRQLVRTQSLGSVGAQTVDSVWPSDDNSSYDSDGLSINELNAASRKLKQKGWCETSLDAPATVTPSTTDSVHTPSVPSPVTPRTPVPPRPILEIPAESNPSPLHVETNIDMFNNSVLADLPKNCTVVQAGQCKPYREVTKPFEMSDFYKYSTKFRERNSEKQNKIENSNGSHEFDHCQEDIYQKGVYQPLQPMKCQPLNTSKYLGSPCMNNGNTSVDSNLGLNASNVAVAEHFSAEMNAWYQTHSHGEGRTSTSPVSLGRSTATLV